MSFKRIISPSEFPTGTELTKRLVSIGFRFSNRPSKKEPNIEETLLAASLEGIAGSYRTLSLLTDWFDIHSERVNADHLIKLVEAVHNPLVKKYWIACAQWKKSDLRFRKMREMDDGKRVHLIDSDSNFLLKRFGEDPRFMKSAIIVHGKVLRHRPSDIDTPEQIAKRHRAYHYRILIGPSYRADLMAAIEIDPELSAAELARKCYSSFSAAWQAKHDYEILNRAS